jgi:hypothetical protein
MDPDDDQEDRACNDLGGGLIVWILGALFNVIANGMRLSALVIRKGSTPSPECSLNSVNIQ